MVVYDAVVLIHLAKLTLLEKSCAYFESAVIPHAVLDEVVAGKRQGRADATIVEELVKANVLRVKTVKGQALLTRARAFNIQGGEAEALALYWQERADYLATDDDNVRKKRVALSLALVGTPAILISLYRARIIEQVKFHESAAELRKIGWFSQAVIDQILTEAR